ncbi:hypothetical protein SOVF_029990 [Spinacia oleracea]|nr:hypothetical protein SOVF_029990 [Spinacia oleracea]
MEQSFVVLGLVDVKSRCWRRSGPLSVELENDSSWKPEIKDILVY